MNNITNQNKAFDFTIPTLIVGTGNTGLSCARYLETKGCPFAFADSRQVSPSFEGLKKEFSQTDFITGDFELNQFKNYSQIIVSPGVSVRNRFFSTLEEQGCLIIGDIELFVQVVDKPVIAITGSNGKSTVTTLVEQITRNCGIKSIAGGNLGTPALELLSSHSDLYILELSSFQLETTYNLHSLSAVVLNVSEDHMDRYTGIDDYQKVKETIYHNCDYKIINLDEKSIAKQILAAARKDIHDQSIILFSSNKPENTDYGLEKSEHSCTLKKGQRKIIGSNDIKLKGTYNYLNILAALALVEPLHLDEQQQVEAIKNYHGLAHRCEWIDEIDGVQYYNDSKGTNTGATIAAINGFEHSSYSVNKSDSDVDSTALKSTTILIAGGVGKDADFTELGELIEKKIKSTVLMGIDSKQIKSSALKAGARKDSLYTVSSMQEAVLTASKLADSGDNVLLSPACASFDMYQNYMQRGDDFKEKVMALKTLVQKRGLQNVG